MKAIEWLLEVIELEKMLEMADLILVKLLHDLLDLSLSHIRDPSFVDIGNLSMVM